MIRTTSCLTALLGAALLLSVPLAPPRASAQATVVAGQQTGAAMQLRIVILDGDNALNNIRQRTAREPVIQVEDENHKPVAGVAIVFLVHGGNTGASGSFAGAQSFSTVTDATGRAVGKGFTSNSVSGNFTIEVTATVGAGAATATAVSAIIHQSNIFGGAEITQTGTAAKHVGIFTKHFWVVTGTAVAVGGTIAAVAVLTNSNGATITAGSGGVTHP